MRINTKNVKSSKLKKFLIKDFWKFIEQHKYFITVSLDFDRADETDKTFKRLLQSLNDNGVFSNITSGLTFKNSLYIEYDMHVIKEFLTKYIDNEEFINVQINKDFIVVPIDVILKSLNVSSKELMEYK